jgi:hypothetical protein
MPGRTLLAARPRKASTNTADRALKDASPPAPWPSGTAMTPAAAS